MQILHMSDDNCIEKRIILIAAEYSGFTVEFHQGCKLGLCDKAPEYLQFLAQEPFLEIHETQLDVADGTIVIGANNIARFLCKFKYTFGPGADAKLQRVFQPTRFINVLPIITTIDIKFNHQPLSK
ncbi:hypothetical protein TSUD_277730 [Trifolium subterraneum]|uniref:Uncharacterized protein n=1 Tax=Trifolium subterraneum TaxID=3900 RepID=A0A2Z6MRC4_TRISU|nr:hypothetical protein TSUD_277730 [Trifolium subterraneum]